MVVSLSPWPDLTPTQVGATTPGSTAALTAAVAGNKIDVTWTVQNIGQGNATRTWYDTLSLQEVGGTRKFGLGVFEYATPLPAGKSYTHSEQVQLPSDVSGVFQVVVQTNSGTEFVAPIFENGATANNILGSTNTLTLTVAPNPNFRSSPSTARPPTPMPAGRSASTSRSSTRGLWKRAASGRTVFISPQEHP